MNIRSLLLRGEGKSPENEHRLHGEQAHNIVVVDLVTRRNILMAICYYSSDKPGYGIMMRRVKRIQELIERKHGISLGYKFQDEHPYTVWDNDVLEDLEILDLGDLIDNEDYMYEKNIFTHNLGKITPNGEIFFKNLIKPQLENFKSGLLEDIETAVTKIEGAQEERI